MDKYYTPLDVARAVLAKAVPRAPSIAADFAAGDGALLQVVAERWPQCKLIATDLDPAAVRSVENKIAGVWASVSDFLDSHAHTLTPILSKVRGQVDLAFINPPFSSRGSTRYRAVFQDKVINCSKPMAFLLNTVQYIRSDGQIIAFLPSSCFTSERDYEALCLLRREFAFEAVAITPTNAFKNCSVEVCCVSLTRHIAAPTARLKPATDRNLVVRELPWATVMRGTIPISGLRMWDADTGVPLVHTSDLRLGFVEPTHRFVQRERASIWSPAVFLPRVGRPSVEKICLYDGLLPVGLSDCIISIQCGSAQSTAALYSSLRTNWPIVAQAYMGSCAKYVTLARMRDMLRDLGHIAVFTTRRQLQQDSKDSFLETQLSHSEMVGVSAA